MQPVRGVTLTVLSFATRADSFCTCNCLYPATEDDINLATTLFGLISFTRGLGSILTAPISSYLVTHPLSASPTTGFGISNGKYGSMVIFVGVSLAVAAGMEAAVSM